VHISSARLRCERRRHDGRRFSLRWLSILQDATVALAREIQLRRVIYFAEQIDVRSSVTGLGSARSASWEPRARARFGSLHVSDGAANLCSKFVASLS
jgi:hypothetical protein